MKVVVIHFKNSNEVKTCMSRLECEKYLRENGEDYSLKYLRDIYEYNLLKIVTSNWEAQVVNF